MRLVRRWLRYWTFRCIYCGTKLTLIEREFNLTACLHCPYQPEEVD